MSGVSWVSDGIRLDVPFSSPGVSTVMLLDTGDRQTMVECGDGAASYLYSLNGRKTEQYERLDSVLISHEHLDHAGGVAALLGLLEVAGRRSAIEIASPGGARGALRRGISPMLEKLNFEVRFRNSTSLRGRMGNVDVEGFRTRHRDSFPANRCGEPVPSTGYVLHCGGRRIVFSGDTGPTKLLDEKCSGADLAVLESTWDEPVDCEGLHMTVKEAMAAGALAREFMLIHPLRDRQGARLF